MLLLTSWSQRIKTVAVKVENGGCKEVTHVLKDNQSIMHGPYKKTCEAFEVKGEYDRGKKIGIWEYYGRKGALEQKIDYSKDSTVFNKGSGFVIKSSMLNDTTAQIPLQMTPIFLGGDSRIAHYLVRYLRYPALARRSGAQGTVLISATVTYDGKMTSEKVERGVGYGLDEEALRIIQMLPDDWLPAKSLGNAVDARILLQVKFKLN